MNVIKITPRGYCYGVVDAIQLARRVAQDPDAPKPVYVLGRIVHNRHAVASLEKYGIVSLEGDDRLALLDEVDHGTVVFTAHGVSPAVKEKAKAKGLNCVDATCPDVTRTHDLVKRLSALDYQIVYVGKKGHPEPEGVLGEAPGQVSLVQSLEDVEALRLDPGRKIVVTTQTTLSKWDTQAVIDRVVERYPGAEVYNEICTATQQRQEAAVAQSINAEVVLVVGDPGSNNSNRLVEVVSKLAGREAHLIEDLNDIRPEWLAGRKTVAVTSGSSTPSELTREVIRHLEGLEIQVSQL